MYLKDKKVKDNVELWIWTDYAIQAMADFNGYTDIIEKSGGKLLNSSCPECLDAAMKGRWEA